VDRATSVSDRAQPRRIVILTSSELRHDFFRKAMALAPGIEVLRTYREGVGTLRATIDATRPGAELQARHLALREQSEQDFFGPFVALTPDHSHPVSVPRGAVNSPAVFEDIQGLAPDLVVAYGPSLIRDPLLSAYAGRFLNVHLGLSPYYRGSGTNFWPLVNGEPEYVGATFMHLDAGVDTGPILHQLRARVFPGDTPHQIGNRLIGDMTVVYAEVVRRAHELGPGSRLPEPAAARVYRRRDFGPEAVEALYANFGAGLVDCYLAERAARSARVPIHEHPLLRAGIP
jgi:hypothetical protein